MHMVLSYHKSDYRKLPDEDCVTDAMRGAGVTPGPAYFFPYFSFKEMKSAPVIEKMKRGPVGFLTVLPSGPPAMAKNLFQWFLYCLVISIFAAYLSGRLLTPGTAFLQALAFKWQRIMFVCWRDRVAYDESTYLDGLKRRGSPLASKLELTLANAA